MLKGEGSALVSELFTFLDSMEHGFVRKSEVLSGPTCPVHGVHPCLIDGPLLSSLNCRAVGDMELELQLLLPLVPHKGVDPRGKPILGEPAAVLKLQRVNTRVLDQLVVLVLVGDILESNTVHKAKPCFLEICGLSSGDHQVEVS